MSNHPSSSTEESGPRRADAQIEALIKYMSENKIFARVEYEVCNSKRFNVKWANLADTLNELGPFKSHDQWRKLWSNLKADVKKRNASWSKWNIETGNKINLIAPSEPNDKDRLILLIIGEETSAGLDVREVGPALTPDNIEVNYNSNKGEDDDFNMVETINHSPQSNEIIAQDNKSKIEPINIIIRRTTQPLESTSTTLERSNENDANTIKKKKKTECHPQHDDCDVKLVETVNNSIEKLNLTLAVMKSALDANLPGSII